MQGHWAGGQKLIDVVQWCIEDGVQILTVYAFSTENWNRDPLEIAALMNIFIKHTESLKKEAVSKNIRVKILSTSYDRLPENVATAVRELESISADCTGFQLNVCLSYGSTSEIADACKRIAIDVKLGNIDANDINEKTVSRYLLTADFPGKFTPCILNTLFTHLKYYLSKKLYSFIAFDSDPDILIRTSGEYRLSNFLLYQVSCQLNACMFTFHLFLIDCFCQFIISMYMILILILKLEVDIWPH